MAIKKPGNPSEVLNYDAIMLGMYKGNLSMQQETQTLIKDLCDWKKLEIVICLLENCFMYTPLLVPGTLVHWPEHLTAH